MYRVINEFADITDGWYVYRVGDTYPRDGQNEVPDRIEELSTDKNKLGVALIEKVVTKKSNSTKEPRKSSK